jgi:hypothetical protein
MAVERRCNLHRSSGRGDGAEPDVVTSGAGCRETRENLRVSFSRHFRLVSPHWGRVPAETLPGSLLLSAPPTLSRLRRDRTYSAHV